MLITPLQIENEPLLFKESLPAGRLEYAPDLQQLGDLSVEGRADLILEHRGTHETVADIRVRARYGGSFEMLCARCLDPVALPVAGDFDLLFRPQAADADSAERAITIDETEIGYYSEGGLLLEDVVREQVLLSVPGRMLCTEDCEGLCPRCGQNLNQAQCTCQPTVQDPRWNALAGLDLKVKLQ